MIRHHPANGNLAALVLIAALWIAAPALALHIVPIAHPAAAALPELA